MSHVLPAVAIAAFVALLLLVAGPKLVRAPSPPRTAAEDRSPGPPLWMTDMVMLWTEDDATVADPDHVTIARAWWLLFAELEPLIPDDVYDAGDAEFRIYPLGRVACHGPRGHSRIYQATHRPKEGEPL